MTAVAERLEPPELFEWFAAKRDADGPRHRRRSTRRRAARSPRSCARGALVGLLCDRDLQDNGIDVELFGSSRRRCPRDPPCSRCAPGATLLCAAVYSGPGRDHHVVVTPPVDTHAPAARSATTWRA